MKRVMLLILVLSAGLNALACDVYLKRFPRDCQLQDRLRQIKISYKSKGLDVNEVAEYRVMRFVDRPSWEKAKKATTAPKAIYNPMPITWEVWDQGIRSIFKAGDHLNGILYRGFHLDDKMFSAMNYSLLTNGSESIKDPNTDKTKKPGEFRHEKDLGVGFCNPGIRDSVPSLESSKKSMMRFEQSFEQKIGMTFEQLVRKKGGSSPETATLVAGMTQSANPNCKPPNSWVNFVPTAEVQNQLDSIKIFIEANLQLFQLDKPVLSPVELAAYVQKWFVTVHPFSDGNGRTSRAVEDVMLSNFDLPFAPAGDLYNDATVEWEVYLEQTYKALESMLTVLESCAKYSYHLPVNQRPFYCATVQELNK